jgi:hypothetical protein
MARIFKMMSISPPARHVQTARMASTKQMLMEAQTQGAKTVYASILPHLQIRMLIRVIVPTTERIHL